MREGRRKREKKGREGVSERYRKEERGKKMEEGRKG